MKSNWCASDEHSGCQIHGLMRRPDGKKFRCKCSCHPPAKRPKKRRDEDDDDRQE